MPVETAFGDSHPLRQDVDLDRLHAPPGKHRDGALNPILAIKSSRPGGILRLFLIRCHFHSNIGQSVPFGRVSWTFGAVATNDSTRSGAQGAAEAARGKPESILHGIVFRCHLLY